VSTYERELLEQVTTPTSEDFVRAATDLQAIRRRLRKEAEMETLDIAELATLDRLMADCGASSDLLQRRYQSARKRPQQVSVGGWFSWIFGA